MLSTSFAKLIKTLQRETLEIKNTHRRSTLTVQTITKSIQVSATKTVDEWGRAYISNPPVIEIAFNTTEPQLIMASFDDPNDASPFGFYFPDIATTEPGKYTLGIWLHAASGQTPSTVVSATFKVNITSTGDFTLRVIRNGS